MRYGSDEDGDGGDKVETTNSRRRYVRLHSIVSEGRLPGKVPLVVLRKF